MGRLEKIANRNKILSKAKPRKKVTKKELKKENEVVEETSSEMPTFFE
jgi:hypothetical protein